MDDTGRLLKSFAALEESLDPEEKKGGDPHGALRAIVELNKEIARIAQDRPGALPQMRAIQERVNEVTKAVKSGNFRQAKKLSWEVRSKVDLFLKQV
jgi:hypothetical protein